MICHAATKTHIFEIMKIKQMLRVLWRIWNVDVFGMWQVWGKFPQSKNLVKTKYEIENAQNLIWSTNLLLTTKGILAWQSFTRFVFDFFGCSVYIPLTIVECRKCALRAHSLHPTIVLGCKHYSLPKSKQILFTLTS